MRKIIKGLILVSVCALLAMCNQKVQENENNESILKGSATVLVDETLLPIMEDQVAVFESSYDAKVKLVPKSESEIISSLVNEKSGIVVLTRILTEEENKIFQQKKINPKITKFATDAIAFISHKSINDTLVDLKNVIEFMQGKTSTGIKGLVFDNPNSSTVRYMNELAGIKSTPENGVYSFKTNEEVIKFVAQNEGVIGILGINWLSQPMPAMQKYVDKVNILSVKGLSSQKYYAPSQNNIAEGTYPLARDLFIVNCQGYTGLGMGFASFVAGDIGQRIILKSGLLPTMIPGRKIKIRNKISNEK
jgi:phosphate transport system substrate-binding protein